MKWRMFILLAGLAACSPRGPTAADVQFAIENYTVGLADAKARADPAQTPLLFSGALQFIGRCDPIAALSVLSTDGDVATVRIGFAARDGYMEVQLKRNSNQWYLVTGAKTPPLPCKALRVGGIDQPLSR